MPSYIQEHTTYCYCWRQIDNMQVWRSWLKGIFLYNKSNAFKVVKLITYSLAALSIGGF